MSSFNKHRVLITGATGMIGKSLLNELEPFKNNLIIRAASRSSKKVEEFIKQGMEAVYFDYDDYTCYGEALDGVDVVFLLTGYTVDMLVQSKAVVDYAKKCGVQHIVHLGVWARDNTTYPHQSWHQFIEKYIEASGLDYTHLQPNWFMQNVPWFSAKSIKENGCIQNFLADTRVSWVDVNDVAAAAAVVLAHPREHRGKTYPLAIDMRSLDEIAEIASEIIGKPFHYEALPLDNFLNVVKEAGIEDNYANAVKQVYQASIDGTLDEVAGGFDVFPQLTGRQPHYWEDFIRLNRDEFAY